MTPRRFVPPRLRVVRYVDTSIFLNILNVPGRNQHRQEVQRAFEQAVADKEMLMLSLASIIETGNHIAHLTDGSDRKRAGDNFAELLRKTVRSELPWTLDRRLAMDVEDLEFYAREFPSYAMQGVGMGDLSLIRDFQRYVDNLKRAGVRGTRVFVWSLDSHLAAYCVEL